MSKQDWVECLLFAGFRVVSITLFLVSATRLLIQLIDSWYRFDPNYLSAFLLGTILRPGMMLAAAAALYLASAPLARRMATRFSTGSGS